MKNFVTCVYIHIFPEISNLTHGTSQFLYTISHLRLRDKKENLYKKKNTYSELLELLHKTNHFIHSFFMSKS